jgi:hypothetical protein
MIIDDFDAFRRAFAPDEADSPLIVDPDTMLTLPVAAQSLKPVSRNRRHVLQLLGIVQHPKFQAQNPSSPCRARVGPRDVKLGRAGRIHFVLAGALERKRLIEARISPCSSS